MQGAESKRWRSGRSKSQLQSGKKSNYVRRRGGLRRGQEELREIIEFLKDPRNFNAGRQNSEGRAALRRSWNRKNAFAKAVAGEAGVPFFSSSAANSSKCLSAWAPAGVRDLFDQGRKSAPAFSSSIEIDAVGRHRFAGIAGAMTSANKP